MYGSVCAIAASPTIVDNPPESLIAYEGENVSLSCRAIGKPMPIINWRLNYAEIPPEPRVTSKSVDGEGILTIGNIRLSDQGFWSCEAINSRDIVLGANDCFIRVKRKSNHWVYLFTCLPTHLSTCLALQPVIWSAQRRISMMRPLTRPTVYGATVLASQRFAIVVFSK